MSSKPACSRAELSNLKKKKKRKKEACLVSEEKQKQKQPPPQKKPTKNKKTGGRQAGRQAGMGLRAYILIWRHAGRETLGLAWVFETSQPLSPQ